MDVVVMAIAFCTTAVLLALIYARSVERVIRLSRMERVEALEEKKQPTSVHNPLKQAFTKAYTVED